MFLRGGPDGVYNAVNAAGEKFSLNSPLHTVPMAQSR